MFFQQSNDLFVSGDQFFRSFNFFTLSGVIKVLLGIFLLIRSHRGFQTKMKEILTDLSQSGYLDFLSIWKVNLPASCLWHYVSAAHLLQQRPLDPFPHANAGGIIVPGTMVPIRSGLLRF